MRALGAALAAAGWALLGLAALAGVILSVVALLAGSEAGRPVIASAIVRIADEAVAGRLELEGIQVLPRGGIEVRGLRAFDPDGHLVLAVDRARIFADLTHLRSRVIGVSAELDGPSVLLEEEPDGGLSLARAFAPAHPGPARAPDPGAPRDEGPGWTVRVQRLTVRGADLWWVDARGATRLEAAGLALDARGAVGPDDSRAELRAVGALDVPVAAPLEIAVRASRKGDEVKVSVLSVTVGDTGLAAVGEGDLVRRTGRVHLARLGIDRAQARALVPAADLGADLAAEAFAEADGAVATAAIHVAPAAGERGPGPGKADAALAVRLDGARALGFDVALERLDPSKVLGPAPAGEVTLTAHGAVAGDSRETLRARIELALARSRLRGGEAGPAEVVLRANRGSWDVSRLAATAPGLALEGAGRWREGGSVSGRLAANASDLAAAARNLSLLLAVKLPDLGGQARLAALLSGTAEAPAITATLAVPFLREGSVAATALHAEVETSGPLRAPTVRLDASADALRTGRDERAHALFVRGTFAGGEGQLSASAAVPALGRDPVSLQARGRLGERGETLALSELVVGYPGTRYALVRPALVTLAGPRVDRLELAAGPQRVALEGGIAARGALDARLLVEALDLARLPVGGFATRERIAGRLGADLRVQGTLRRPRLAGRLALEGGALRTLAGLRAVADVRWDGGARRAAASIGLARDAGGTLDVALDLPVPLAGRPSEAVSVRVRAAGLPLELLLGAAGEDLPAAGLLGLDAAVTGSVSALALHAAATLEGGRWEDLGGVGLTATADAPGERLDLHLEAALAARPAAIADLSVPLDLSDLVVRPAAVARALRSAPLSGQVRLTGLELTDLAGRLGLPDDLRGRLSGEARVEGALDAPRGTLALDLAAGAFAGYAGVTAHLETDASAAAVAVRGQIAIEGDELLRGTASLGAPIERLATRAGLRAAPLALDAAVPRVALARAARLEVPLAGTVEARLTAEGTLVSPRFALDATGSGLTVEGRPLGEATLRARGGEGRVTAEARLAPTAGGALHATFAVEASPGLDLRTAALRAAPAELAVKADAVDLGVLAALAPELVRTAAGKLEADVVARGPLARLTPSGRVRVADGRLAISEYGDFTAVALDVAVTADAVEVRKLFARRGAGTLEGHASLRGLRAGKGELEGRLTAEAFPISRSGMELAKVTARVDATGAYHPRALEVKLTIPKGTVRLPKRTPRKLQTLERRTDIVVGRRPERKVARADPGGGPPEQPFALTVRVVVPGRFDVVSDSPRMKLELKADLTYELLGRDDYASGSIEVVRGNVEPIDGRLFEVESGKVTFTGGPPRAAMLDVEARWDNPSAVVKVRVAGPLVDPEIKLSSQPPLDEAQIAMLIATGRTELKAGAGGVGTLTGEEAGKAALGAIATKFFKDVVADKLPLDTVALESGALRAGKYFSDNDKIYVGYTRRFDAQSEQGENTNEVRVEYQISRRWTLESRYGDAQSGGASLIWSKDY